MTGAPTNLHALATWLDARRPAIEAGDVEVAAATMAALKDVMATHLARIMLSEGAAIYANVIEMACAGVAAVDLASRALDPRDSELAGVIGAGEPVH